MCSYGRRSLAHQTRSMFAELEKFKKTFLGITKLVVARNRECVHIITPGRVPSGQRIYASTGAKQEEEHNTGGYEPSRKQKALLLLSRCYPIHHGRQVHRDVIKAFTWPSPKSGVNLFLQPVNYHYATLVCLSACSC
jgi:hypothetical protein